MPSEMYERGRRDAEADALDENYYHYYYDYKQAYDLVSRKRRRVRQQRMARQIARWALLAVPVLLLFGGVGYAGSQAGWWGDDVGLAQTATATATPRPTLVPPTPRVETTPTPELALRPDGFAVVVGTQGGRLQARQTPGTGKDDVIARFEEGETVRILEGPQTATDMTWWRIEGQGKQGWASATYLQPVPPPQ
jgi:hypothetical protein